MKSSPGARSWIAAGVRHELLTRALPALRHHMVAPVSVIRMGLLLLKRQIGAPEPDAAACEQRIGSIDEQVTAVVDGIRSLRDWELAAPGEDITRSALVAQCAGLLRTPFELGGIVLEIDQAVAEPGAGEPLHGGAPALRYLLLGALCHLHDSVERLRCIRIQPDGAAALLLRASAGEGERPGGSTAYDAQRAPRALAIDTVALQALADDLGYHVTLEPGAVRLRLDDEPPLRAEFIRAA